MNDNEVTVRRMYEDWSEIMGKLDALSSTINSIKYGLEREGIEEQVTDCLTTLNDSVVGIIRFARKKQLELAYKVKDEDDKHERESLMPVLGNEQD